MTTPESSRAPSRQGHPPPLPPPPPPPLWKMAENSSDRDSSSCRWRVINHEEPKMTSEEETPPRSTAKEFSFQWLPCARPGNPVFSCMLDAKTLTTSNFLTKPQLLLYKTTSSEYGNIPPTSQMVPCKFYPRNNSFTNHLFACGLTEFNSINTGVDRSKVYDHPDIMNLL
uniref:Piercer of microtubule wall 2 protein isoform X1 n=2 Tax=Pogona vitticeps TaxID=103695 RepID=A0ABM5EY24_9SAUR